MHAASRRFSFATPSFRLPRPGRTTTVAVEVDVQHSVATHLRRFLDFAEAVELGGLTHQFEVVTADDPDDAFAPGALDAIAALAPPRAIEHADVNSTQRARVRLARLGVAEYPDAWRRWSRATWYDVFDGIEGPVGGGILTEMVLDVIERGDHPHLCGGSAFVYRSLEVHPALRGQGLGTRLIAHAMAALSRSDTDLSVLVAYPIASSWDVPARNGDPKHVRGTTASLRRLVRTYERASFIVWKPPRQQGKAAPTPCTSATSAPSRSWTTIRSRSVYWWFHNCRAVRDDGVASSARE